MSRDCLTISGLTNSAEKPNEINVNILAILTSCYQATQANQWFGMPNSCKGPIEMIEEETELTKCRALNVTGTDRKIDARLTSPDSPDVHGWQPIETAPKDGTRIQLMRVKMPKFQNLPDILWIKIGSWRAHWADRYEEGWREDAVAAPSATDHLRLVPSHWTPLPAPPVLL